MKANVKTMVEVNFTSEEQKAMDTVWEICDKLLAILKEQRAGRFVEAEKLDVIDNANLMDVRNILVDLKNGKNWEVK